MLLIPGSLAGMESSQQIDNALALQTLSDGCPCPAAPLLSSTNAEVD